MKAMFISANHVSTAELDSNEIAYPYVREGLSKPGSQFRPPMPSEGKVTQMHLKQSTYPENKKREPKLPSVLHWRL
jgi:hypothetical protein